MTSTTTITAASTDLLGLGGIDVRTGGLIVHGPAAQHERAGLSSAACCSAWSAVLGGGAGLAHAAAFDRRPKSLRTVERPFVPTYLPQHDGTTLGIRSPGRPLS